MCGSLARLSAGSERGLDTILYIYINYPGPREEEGKPNDCCCSQRQAECGILIPSLAHGLLQTAGRIGKMTVDLFCKPVQLVLSGVPPPPPPASVLARGLIGRRPVSALRRARARARLARARWRAARAHKNAAKFHRKAARYNRRAALTGR